MNTDNLILRETDNLPLINKNDTLESADLDGNFINIYNDFLDLSIASDPTLIYDVEKSYAIGEYTTYDGRMWLAIEVSTASTPSTSSIDWVDVFPTILAHEKNKDTILDEGGVNETTVAEIRAFIDAGLTSTTNLSLTTKTSTSFKIESSTGSDIIIPQADEKYAGLLRSSDKLKLNNLSGINTGDQTLISLNAEDVDNKVTDFTTINDTLYPTTQAVDTYLTAVVPDLVDTFLGGVVAQDLQDVTTVGNTTTDNIAFTGGVGVLFDNTSTLRKGTIDAGYGGAKGIAQICSVGYELKWEAGRLYVMGDGGLTIREVSHNFTTTPSTTDDITKGFVIGSRWILDNGNLYVCTDATESTAIWVLETITTADISDSLNKRYVTDANLTVIGNTSGTNTGDQTISDATITTTDITTNNFTTAKHGFVPKGTNVGNYLKDDGTWGAISAGGLTYFTESQSTASPNATVNVDSLTAVASTTDADFSILAKGTGAILASIPNNIATVPNIGGNKRGQYALDLQHYGQININTEVASGNYSVITGGFRNTASNQYSFVGTGSRNTASGDYSAIISGQQNTVSNNYASVVTGFLNTASNIYACVIGGFSNGASGQYSISGGAFCSASGNKSLALGESNTASGFSAVSLNSTNTASSDYSNAIGYNSNTGTTWGKWVLGGGGATLGSSQKGLLVLTIRTTGNTPTELAFASTAGADLRSQMTCADNMGMRVKGSIIGKQSGSTNISAWDFDYVIVRGVGVGTTIVVVSNVNVVTNIPAWGTPTITADTAKGFASIKVTGATTTNIQWTATIESTEVIYA
ncbi:LbR_YadA-like domain containing protein [uncultured Caudovirales phage]|uniref:LbR_YadA-like domain containing protein n=1 Tax=uncultured Caudovirales phage TaxID=2100421 RepID=A0A6J5N023_9CAUD|nr:LbR_YadA-like domain containing protein [uncultured Caudovirales phage]